jgi:hypothetical protein
MNTEETAIRLAGKLSQLTETGKLTWTDAGALGPWGERPGQVFKASVESETGVGTIAQIAEIPFQGLSNSYYFGLAEGNPGIFEVIAQETPDELFRVFAEGYPADPTDEKLKLLNALKYLYLAAHESARDTRQKVEKFEQVLERRLA